MRRVVERSTCSSKHGANAPSCALAHWGSGADSGKLWIWTHSQGIYPLRGDMAQVLGMPEQDIIITHAEGAVGRRLFAVSSLVFMVLQTLSILVKSMGDSVDDSLIDAVGEGLSVASWVMLWFPIQLFTVEVWRSSIRRRRSTVLERMTVQVQPRS